MKFDIIASAIATGLFWGAIIGGIYRWAGRKSPGVNARSFKWFAWTAIIAALGYYWLYGFSH